MLLITINDFIITKMCSASLCASMTLTVEQFVEVCSSNRASDADCCIYSKSSQCAGPGLPKSICTCTEHLLTHTEAAVSHRYGPFPPSCVSIKTLKLLAPSSTNPIALCSLIPQPNGLSERFYSPLSHSVSESERLRLFVMNGQGEWGEG